MSEASMRCRLRDLALVAEADIRGRDCEDKQDKLDSIALFAELAKELGCFNGPRRFANDHSRVLYFRGARDAADVAYDDTELTVTLLSGLPATGKTHWRDTHRPGLPVVCLDEVRSELGVSADAEQGRVRQLANERAREHLRDKRDFVWDSTNLDAKRRRKLIDLFLDYHARVEVVAVEADARAMRERNARRVRPVPRAVIDNMMSTWVVPDPTEAHAVTRYSSSALRP